MEHLLEIAGHNLDVLDDHVIWMLPCNTDENAWEIPRLCFLADFIVAAVPIAFDRQITHHLQKYCCS